VNQRGRVLYHDGRRDGSLKSKVQIDEFIHLLELVDGRAAIRPRQPLQLHYFQWRTTLRTRHGLMKGGTQTSQGKRTTDNFDND
jgi:hypothetical protein